MNDHERHVSILVGSRALEHAADALTVSPSRATTKGAVRGSDGLCKLGAKGAIAQLRENLRELGATGDPGRIIASGQRPQNL